MLQVCDVCDARLGCLPLPSCYPLALPGHHFAVLIPTQVLNGHVTWGRRQALAFLSPEWRHLPGYTSVGVHQEPPDEPQEVPAGPLALHWG